MIMVPSTHHGSRRLRRRAAALAALLSTGAALVASGPASATTPLDAQQRVSQMGPDGDVSFVAQRPAVAYNPRADQYLAVWSGNAVGDELEIWGRLIDARGVPVGGQLRISDMGPDGDPNYQATEPSVAYDPSANEYLVAWQGWDSAQTPGEEEIFVQRLAAAGSEVGANDVRISSMGPDGDTGYVAEHPVIATGSATAGYLVAWQGNDAGGGGLSNDEREVFVQRLDASANEMAADDRRISDMGPDGDARFDAGAPAVAHNALSNEYLVAWDGAELVPGDVEIHVQRLDAGGAEIGVNDQRISDTGPAGGVFVRASDPAVAANERSGEYLVAWDGDDSPPLVSGELEVFVQRLDSAGAEVGADDRRVSDMGPDGDVAGQAREPSVAYNVRADEYLVAWQGWNPPELAPRKDEVFAQRLDASGAETGGNDLRVSTMGADDDPDFSGLWPAVAYGAPANEYLVVWEGGDLNAPNVDNESEIHARRFGAAAPPAQTGAAVCRALAPPPSATPGDPGKVTLSVAQLLINQRIDQAAIRRANGVQAWLDAGVEGRDVCQGAIGRAELRSEVVTGFTGLPLTLGPPSPRPVPVPPAGKPDPGSVTLTTGQILINQRISQAAIRRLNALKARLDAGLTGGDVDDGQLGRAQLTAGTQVIFAPPPAGPPARSATSIAPAKRGDPGKVTLSVAQLLINQRISQAGVRRANDLIRRIDAGLGAADIADGSVTGADLAPGVALSTR